MCRLEIPYTHSYPPFGPDVKSCPDTDKNHIQRKNAGWISAGNSWGWSYETWTDYFPHLLVPMICRYTKTKARHPQTNGICECFYKTILQEFCQVVFRRKLHHSLEELQAELDAGIDSYNSESGLIKGKCAAAERLCRHSLTENNSGWKRSDSSTNRAGGASKRRPLSDQV